MAGSVSSGTSISRSCSKASRLRLTPVERLFFFGIREVDAEDLLAALEHVLADAPGLLLCGRLRQRRQGQTAGNRGRHGLEETSAAHSLCKPLHRFSPGQTMLNAEC